jgi:hypothetical protein
LFCSHCECGSQAGLPMGFGSALHAPVGCVFGARKPATTNDAPGQLLSYERDMRAV